MGRNELWHFCDSIKWDQRAPIFGTAMVVVVVEHKVRSLTQLFTVCFLYKKIIDSTGDQTDSLASEKVSFFSVPPSKFILSVLDPLKCFLSRHSALQRPTTSPHALPLQFQGYNDTASSAEVPCHCQKQLAQTWIVKS